MITLSLWKQLSQEWLPLIKDYLQALQSLVIIVVSIFTAYWAYKTFGHKEKIQELKALKKTIMLYHFKVVRFCAQVREGTSPDDREINEKLELGSIHNELVGLASLNLYTKTEVRQRVQELVGRWIDNDRSKKMQCRKGSGVTQKERADAWKAFNEEYKEVKEIIDTEAGKLL